MNNHGFSMIEMLFVLAITIILASFGFVFHTPDISSKDEIRLISNAFINARMKACALKEKQTVDVNEHDLYIVDADGETHIHLPKGYYFKTSHKFTYNANGRIKGAKTIDLATPEGEKKFVFQVGSGTFYVK